MKFQSFVNFPKKIKEIIKMFWHFWFFTCYPDPYVSLYSYSHYVQTSQLWKAYLNTYVKNEEKKKNTHFKISSRVEVFTHLFLLPRWNFIPVFLTEMSSFRDEISSRQKRVNSKRHFHHRQGRFHPGMKFHVKTLSKSVIKLSVS